MASPHVAGAAALYLANHSLSSTGSDPENIDPEKLVQIS